MSLFCELDIEERRSIIGEYTVSNELFDYLVDYVIDISDMDFYECYNNEILDTGEGNLATYLLNNKPYIILSRVEPYLINNNPEYLVCYYGFENDEIDKYFENCPYGKRYKRNERIKNILE